MEIDMISNMEWFEGSFTNCAYRTYVYIYIYKKEKNNEIYTYAYTQYVISNGLCFAEKTFIETNIY